jgi:hypothetical protein
MVLNSGPASIEFFNASGFYNYDGSSCTWLNYCGYNCEDKNYDSRFLDFAGVWTIIGKRGFSSVNLQVNAWIGNAFDALGPNPVVKFTLVSNG